MKQTIISFYKEYLGEYYNYFLLITIILISYILSFALYKIVQISVIKIYDIEKSNLKRRIKTSFKILCTVILVSLLISFTDFYGYILEVINKVLHLLLILSLAIFFIRLLALVRDILQAKFDEDGSHNLSERKVRTQIDFIYKLGSVFIVIIALAISFMSFSRAREIGTSILASAGIVGIIVGIAAQRSIANLLAGLQLAFTQPIRLDDVVVVEGEFGRIEEVTLTYIVVRLWDDRRIILPISYFIEKPFQNWTRTSADIIGSVFIHVDYTMPVDEIRKEVKRILENEGKLLWDGKNSNVHVTDCTDRTMVVRITAGAHNSTNAFELRCMIREKVISFIQNNYPHCLPKEREQKLS
ncbi:MAG: mechanosensitive ion channel family protein [Cytophagaceae bacterium]|nr:mechanosensitive ion channel family protein [Cytophagaceae bacterium]MDW8456939.1 mechanosensitive ion channel [Cytophagaceae bacterium]